MLARLITLLDAKSALNTAGAFPQIDHLMESAVYVIFGPAASAGKVIIEGAHLDSYTGTWAPLETIVWRASNRVHHIAITGVHVALRVRIAEAIIGDTVTVYWAAR